MQLSFDSTISILIFVLSEFEGKFDKEKHLFIGSLKSSLPGKVMFTGNSLDEI